MPTIQRPPSQRTREPSGIDKFLQTLGLGLNAASAGYQLLKLPRQFQMQEESAARQDRGLDIAQGNLDVATQNADTNEKIRSHGVMVSDAERAITSAVLMTTLSRNQTLQQLTQSGQNVDPSLFSKAVTIGDIPDQVLRERTREAVAQVTGMTPDKVDDNFALSAYNGLEQVLNDQKMAFTVREMLSPDNAPAFSQGAREGIMADLSGQAGRTIPGAQLQETADRFALNEVFRMDPTTGKATGMLVTDPTQGMRMLFAKAGLPEPLTQFDAMRPDGTIGRVRVPMETYAGIVRDLAQGAISKDVNYASILAGAGVKLATDTGIPLAVAGQMINDPTSITDPKWTGMARSIATAKQAALVSLENFPAMNLFKDAIELAKLMGTEEGRMFDESVKLYNGMIDGAARSGLLPGRLSRITDRGALEDIFRTITMQGFGSNFPAGNLPNMGGTLIPGNPFGPMPGGTSIVNDMPAGSTMGTVQQALPAALELYANSLRGLSPEQVEASLNASKGQSFVDERTGEAIIVNDQIIKYIRTRLQGP